MIRPKSFVDAEQAELIRRVCRGDREAYYILVEPCERAIFNAAMSILANITDAEEVAQEAVLKAFMHLAEFRGESKFSTWIVQITVNEARQRLRRERRRLYESLDEPRPTEEEGYMPRDFADWREIPSEALERKELRDALRQGIASLAPAYREVFVLRDIEHRSTNETAQILGIGVSLVKTRLLRARLQMRDALAPGIDGSWISGSAKRQKVRPW